MSTAHWQARRLPIPAAWPARSSPAARALLAAASLAGIGIAASPDPARGTTPRHLARTVPGAVTIAVWPAFAARRAHRGR